MIGRVSGWLWQTDENQQHLAIQAIWTNWHNFDRVIFLFQRKMSICRPIRINSRQIFRRITTLPPPPPPYSLLLFNSIFRYAIHFYNTLNKRLSIECQIAQKNTKRKFQTDKKRHTVHNSTKI